MRRYLSRTTVRQIAWHGIPLLLFLGLYWPGLTNWFYQDDFGWLNLRRDVHSWRDLGPALFAPKAHGNIRPLGENAYFLVLSTLFGVNPLPFRICAFLTQMASLVLLGNTVYRLTLSRTAGIWAEILWIVNCGLAPVMCWTSIYNQALSGFFFVLGFYFLVRHTKTGEKRFHLAQWGAFLLGLGALETNVVYPVVASWYCLCCARPFLRRILPMFLVSAIFILMHFTLAPPAHTGVYALHLDWSILSILWTYWTWAIGPTRLSAIRPMPSWLLVTLIAILTGSTLSFVAWKLRKQQCLGLFAIGWFVIVLGPYLPLRDHVADYYLAVPVIGLAILGAWAVASASYSRRVWKVTLALCIGAYCATSLPASWAIVHWHHDRGIKVENLVLGVAEAHAAHPDKIILLAGTSTDLFWSGIVNVPFRVMEISHVYLVPGSEANIQAPAELAGKFVLPQALALRALTEDRAVVYEIGGPVLRNITGQYRGIAQALWTPEPPRFINVGDPIFAEYLGEGWEEAEDGYRYMGPRGSIRMGGPHGSTEHLYVDIFDRRTIGIRVRVDGMEVPAKLIRRDYEISEFEALLPASAIGRESIELSLWTESAGKLKFGFMEIR